MPPILRAVAMLLVGGVLLPGCSEPAHRGPTSPSASPIDAQSTSWTCGRADGAPGGTSASNGWLFNTPAVTCAARPWLAETAGDGVVTSPPANLRATVTGTTVRLEWGPVASATTFLVEAGSAPALADLARFNTGSAATVLQVSGVPVGAYYLRVRGVGPDGIPGPASNEITVRVGACVAAPAAPTGFASQVSGSQVTLSWTAPAGEAVASYVLEAGSSAGSSNLVIFDTASDATGLQATAPNGTYYVRVRGRNACGTGGPSNESIVNVGVEGPVTPPGSCSYDVSPGTVALSATAGVFDIGVDTAPGCAWTASSGAAFITLAAGGVTSGRGAARFTVDANNGGAVRSGVVRIQWSGGSRDVPVAQVAPPPPPPTPTPPVEEVIQVIPNPEGAPPVVQTVTSVPTPPPPSRPSPSPAPAVTVSPGAAPQTVEVQITASEPFNAIIVATEGGASDRAFATDVSSSHYVIALTSLRVSVTLVLSVRVEGQFVAQFAVSVNSALPGLYTRATISRTLTPCSYSVTPAAPDPIAARGGTVDLSIATRSGCAWSATTDASFLSVSPRSGTGSGTVVVSAAANFGAARSGVVRIAWSNGAQDVRVSQAGVVVPIPQPRLVIEAPTGNPRTLTVSFEWSLLDAVRGRVYYFQVRLDKGFNACDSAIEQSFDAGTASQLTVTLDPRRYSGQSVEFAVRAEDRQGFVTCEQGARRITLP